MLATAPALVLSMASVSAAIADQTATIHASVSPGRLGSPISLTATVSFSSSDPNPQPPVVKVAAYGPAGMTVDTRGAGICTASPSTLEEVGPSACPADSRVGFGKATGLQELAHELIPCPFTFEFFLRPKESGHLSLLIYVSAVTPAAEQLVLTATEVRAPAPYGIGIGFAVPIVHSLPEAPLGWVQRLSMTLGSAHVAYRRVIHGKQRLLHVRGLVAPRTCPRGGFPFEGVFEFADGSSTTSKATVPCPRS